MEQKRFTIGEAVRFGWNTVKADLAYFIGITLIIFIVLWPLVVYLSMVEPFDRDPLALSLQEVTKINQKKEAELS
jgi:hypothetical protein